VLDSTIISDFLKIFAVFSEKRFSLLWRGGCKDFRAPDFHDRCHGRTNTFPLLEDTNGNIFGWFTQLEWDSSNREKFKAHASLKRFLFLMKNCHNVQARRFA
jgi:hypothetical protein